MLFWNISNGIINVRRKCTKLFAEVTRLLVERDCTYLEVGLVALTVQYLAGCLLKEFVLIPRLIIFLLAIFVTVHARLINAMLLYVQYDNMTKSIFSKTGEGIKMKEDCRMG